MALFLKLFFCFLSLFLGGFWVYVRGNIFPIDFFEDDVFEEKSSFFHPGEDEEPEVGFESTPKGSLRRTFIKRTLYCIAVCLPCLGVSYQIGKFFGGRK